jgi:hypothetical protein
MHSQFSAHSDFRSLANDAEHASNCSLLPILLVRHVWLKAMLTGMKTILSLIIICLDDWKNDIDRKKLISSQVIEVRIFRHAC